MDKVIYNQSRRNPQKDFKLGSVVWSADSLITFNCNMFDIRHLKL